MGSRTRTTTTRRRLTAATVTAAAIAVGPGLPARADLPHIDPATLARGPDPSVAHLVDDTIHDGALRVPATPHGEHDALWVVAGGYVVRDHDVGTRQLTRVVFVDPTGARRLVARSPELIDVEVSASGRRMAVQRSAGTSGTTTVVTVSVPRSGRVVARREVRLATLAAVTDHRVLLGKRARWHHPATVWWNVERNSTRRIHDQAALSADVQHDRVVFDRSSDGEFCIRVAELSQPARTLWRSCRVQPHQWSPDGRYAVATHTYFDAAGTDRWWVIDGRTGVRRATVGGRLGWDAAWEDGRHFLTTAQSDAGRAAILRCDLTGSCERASGLWDVPVPADPSVYYAPPPVVLAAR